MGSLELAAEGRRIVLGKQVEPEQLAAWFVADRASLLRFATGVCGDRHVAEDLLQEAYVKVSMSRVDPDQPSAYVKRTILNLSRSGFRRRAAERRALERHGSPQDSTPGPELNDEVWLALEALSPMQRAVLVLRFYEDLTEADIASTLKISRGNVKKHASRGMQKLRERLEAPSWS